MPGPASKFCLDLSLFQHVPTDLPRFRQQAKLAETHCIFWQFQSIQKHLGSICLCRALVWCWADWVKKDIDNVLEAEKLPIADSREKYFYFFNMGKVAVEEVVCMSEQVEDGQIIPVILENRPKFHFIWQQGSTVSIFWAIRIIEYLKTKYSFDFQVNIVTNKILQNRSPSRVQFNG